MFERIIVVTKSTALDELLKRHHTRGQVEFFLERRGTSIAEYDAAHSAYETALARVMAALPTTIPHTVLPRELVATYLFRDTDLVVVVGPDGLAVNVAKYLTHQPMLTVNPDPDRIDGVLMRYTADAFPRALTAVLGGTYTTEAITLAEARTNDGQTLLAVNDFLVGRRDTISSRYTLTHKGKAERQSSSGVLIATGTGSTGWMKSIVIGARGVLAATAGEGAHAAAQYAVPFPRDERYLLFAVREPFPSRYTKTTMVFGRIEEDEELVMTSEMSEGGAIFSDGVTEDAIEFNAGTIVRIGVAERSAYLIE